MYGDLFITVAPSNLKNITKRYFLMVVGQFTEMFLLIRENALETLIMLQRNLFTLCIILKNWFSEFFTNDADKNTGGHG